MGADEDIRELRKDLGALRETVSAHGQQLQNGSAFRSDLDALKEQRPGPRLAALEREMSEVQAAVSEQGHSIKAMTGAFGGMAEELKADRAERKAAEAEALRVEREAAEKKETPIGWLRANWPVIVVGMLCILVLIDALQDDVDAVDVVEQLEQRGVRVGPPPE